MPDIVFKHIDDLAGYIKENGLEQKPVEKFERIEARPAVPGEEVVTVASDETDEVPVPHVAVEGDYVVNNVGNPENRWIIDGGTFARKYERDAFAPGRVFRPKGGVMLAAKINEDISFAPPWGGVQNVRAGGYILQDPANPSDIYGISGEDFDRTYRPVLFKQVDDLDRYIRENGLEQKPVEVLDRINASPFERGKLLAAKIKEDISFAPPWGGVRNIKAGGYILQNPDWPVAVNVISEADFNRTYRFAPAKDKSVRLSASAEGPAVVPESPSMAAERAQGDLLVDRLIGMGIDVRLDRERMKEILASGEYHALADGSVPRSLPSRELDTPSGRCRMLWYSNWDVYGLVQGGTIYLDPDKIKAETPIHEYTHLMTEVVRRKNPALWNRIVSTLRDNPVWEEIRGNAAYASIHGNEDEMADEVLATVSGRRGAEFLAQQRGDYLASHPSASAREAAEAAADGASDAVSQFWNGTADLFGYEHSRSAEDLADTALAYLLAGVNPRTILSVEKSREASRGVSRKSDPIMDGFASAGFPVKDPDDPGRDLSYFRDGETQEYLEGMGLFLECGVNRSTGSYLFGRLTPPAEIVGFEQDTSGSIILRYHEMGDRRRTLRTVPLEDARMTQKDKNALNNWLFHSIRPAGSSRSHDGREAGAVQYALAKRMADGLDSGMPTGVVLERSPEGGLKAVPVGVRKGPRGDEVRPLGDAEMREFIARAVSVGEGPAWKAFMPAAESARKHALSSPLALVRARMEQGLTREFDRLFPGLSKVFFEVERTDRWGMATTEKMGFGAMALLLSGDRSAGLQAQLSHCTPVAERLLNALCRREAEGEFVLTAGDGSVVKVPAPPQQLVASLTLRAVQAAIEGKRTEAAGQLDAARAELAALSADAGEAERTKLENKVLECRLREGSLSRAAELAAEFFRTHSAPYDAPTKEAVRTFILSELLGGKTPTKVAAPSAEPIPWGDDAITRKEYAAPEVKAPLSDVSVAGEALSALLANAMESLAKDSRKALSLRVYGTLALSDGKVKTRAAEPVRQKTVYDGSKGKGKYNNYGKSRRYGNDRRKEGARADFAKLAEAAAGESISHKI